jgi:hypothetical protein
MELLNYIIDDAVDVHIKSETENSRWEKPESLKQSLPERMNNAKALLRASFGLADTTAGKKLINHIITSRSHYPLTACAEGLIDLQELEMPKAHAVTVKTLHDHVTKVMDMELSKGTKAADDWSIALQLPCKCEYCRTVNAFLAARNEQSKTLAIVQQHRNHVMENFKGQLLPVKISVIAKGSPHKLVLDKLPNLQKEANDRFKNLKALRKRLGATGG